MHQNLIFHNFGIFFVKFNIIGYKLWDDEHDNLIKSDSEKKVMLRLFEQIRIEKGLHQTMKTLIINITSELY